MYLYCNDIINLHKKVSVLSVENQPRELTNKNCRLYNISGFVAWQVCSKGEDQICNVSLDIFVCFMFWRRASLIKLILYFCWRLLRSVLTLPLRFSGEFTRKYRSERKVFGSASYVERLPYSWRRHYIRQGSEIQKSDQSWWVVHTVSWFSCLVKCCVYNACFIQNQV